MLRAATFPHFFSTLFVSGEDNPKCFDVLVVLDRSKSLCKDVGSLVFRQHSVEYDLLLLDSLSHKVKAYINVLSPSVMDGILGKKKCCSVVFLNDDRLGNHAKIPKEMAKPNRLLGRFRQRNILGFDGGSCDNLLPFAAPRDSTAGKLKNMPVRALPRLGALCEVRVAEANDLLLLLLSG